MTGDADSCRYKEDTSVCPDCRLVQDTVPRLSLQLWCPACCCVLLALLSQVRQDGVPVKHLQFGHRLLPQVGVKGHRDDGRLLQSEDDEVGLLQPCHRQLDLDLCEVTVRSLQTVDRRLGQRGQRGC